MFPDPTTFIIHQKTPVFLIFLLCQSVISFIKMDFIYMYMYMFART
jgi:hypothetical protein